MSRPRPKGRRRRSRYEPRVGTSIHVKDGIEFACPFCKGHCSASEEHGHVTHTMPPCTKYLTLEPQDFLAAVNNVGLKN